MDEYIKVKDLIDMLEQRLVFQETHGFYRDAGYTSRFIESIADMPHIDVAPKSEWVSVEDRLPERDTYVLVYSETYLKTKIAIFYYEKEDVWHYDSHSYACAEYYGITHWMPLPEPPTEKENSNEMPI